MRVIGFEPTQALSHWILSPVHLTTLAHPHIGITKTNYIKTFRILELCASVAQLVERLIRNQKVGGSIPS